MGKSVSVFGSAPAAPAILPFKEEPPEERDDFNIRDHVGKALLITVHGPKEVETKKYGTKTAISADVVVLDGKSATKFEDILFFSAAVVSQLKKLTGQLTVGIVEEYESSYGTTGFKLAEPPEAAIKAANAYVEAPPF